MHTQRSPYVDAGALAAGIGGFLLVVASVVPWYAALGDPVYPWETARAYATFGVGLATWACLWAYGLGRLTRIVAAIGGVLMLRVAHQVYDGVGGASTHALAWGFPVLIGGGSALVVAAVVGSRPLPRPAAFQSEVERAE